MFSLGLSSRTSTSSKQETPKRVIRARQDYIARETAELTFKKDDFFYVLSTPHEEDRWYEVTNPLSGERGLVPAFCFEVMETRQDRLNRINRSGSNASSTDGARSSLGIPHSLPVSNTLSGTHQQSVSRSNSGQYRRPSGANSPLSAEPTSAMPLRTRTTSIHQQQQQQQQRKYSQSSSSYGSAPMPSLIEPQATVLYDFEAANGNELTIREGEHLAIVAQSTGDWLIARSAQRGNVAGLVPSAYIQLHDHVTGAVVSDLRAYLNRYNMRLRSAVDWEKQQREAWTTNSAHSSVSASSELAAAAGHSLGQNTGGRTRMSSGSNSSYDDQSPTPRSSAGSFLPAAVNALQMSRNRALTSSSSTTTSSIAERSSFRQLHQGRQPSGNSQQHSASENFPRFHKDEIAEVGVPSFICKDGAYLFQVSLTFYTGDERNLYRTYEDFVACRSELHDYFPAETSSLKLARSSIHSSSMLYLNDSIIERRRNELHAYVQGLVATPAFVVEGPTVQRLFGSRVDAVPERQHSPDNTKRRTMQSEYRSSRHAPSLSTDSSMESGLTPASASSTETAVDGHDLDCRGFGAMSIGKPGVGSRRTMTEVPPMPTDHLSTSVDSKAAMQRLSHRPSIGAMGKGSMVKVKIRVGDDMVALRLPSELTLNELKTRIALRLNSEEPSRLPPTISQIAYFGPTGESEPLSDDQDWATALLITNYKPILTIVQ